MEKRVAEFFDHFRKELGRQVELGQKATEPEYLRFQRTVNANVRSGARIRQEFLLRKLLASDPRFVEMFDSGAIAESGLHTAVRTSASQIAKLIARINERYAADHGQDLFKATNKTAQAQVRIGAPVSDYEGYTKLVDDLYFLFHEAMGERLEGKPPRSFEDVNILRTDLRHDVNHGKPKKVRAKRRKGGDVFGKFAGVRSPAGLAPERFLIVQSNLLSALEADLHALIP